MRLLWCHCQVDFIGWFVYLFLLLFTISCIIDYLLFVCLSFVIFHFYFAICFLLLSLVFFVLCYSLCDISFVIFCISYLLVFIFVIIGIFLHYHLFDFCQAQPKSQLKLGWVGLIFSSTPPDSKRPTSFRIVLYLNLKSKILSLNDMTLEISSDHNPICNRSLLTLF